MGHTAHELSAPAEECLLDYLGDRPTGKTRALPHLKVVFGSKKATFLPRSWGLCLFSLVDLSPGRPVGGLQCALSESLSE